MYFNIPLANHPSLVEAQNYLRRIMGDKVQYTNPANFHITLLFSENMVDLSEVRFPEHLPLFGLRTDWIDWMRTPENTYAVVLRVDRAPQLIYLQMALYLETIMAGGKVSRFSYPTTYRPHITLGYSSVEPEYMGIVDSPTALEIREVQLTAKDYQAVKSWQLATTVAVQEQMKARSEPLFIVAEQINSPKAPDIPLPADVDLKALEAALGEVVFATLPIGKVDVKSRNKRHYTKESVASLVKQVNELRPEGRWGHLSEEEMGTRYEPPAIRWLAATLDSKGIAWGKALALTEEAKRHFKTAEATKAKIGSSIFGVDPVVDEQGKIVNYRLVTIDLANSERVGIPEATAVPKITKEMAGEENMPQENELKTTPSISEVEVIKQRDELKHKVDDLEIKVNSLTPFKDDVSKIRETLALSEKGNVVASVTELSSQVNAIRETFGLDAGVNLATFLRDYHERHLKLAQENTTLLGATVKTAVEEQVKIESARGMITEMVLERKPTTSEAVAEAVKAVLEKPSVKEFLQSQMQVEAGPNIQNPVSNPRTMGESQKQYVEIPGA